MFSEVCVKNSVHGGRACMGGDVRGMGVCGGHAWWKVCMMGGVCGRGEGVHGGGSMCDRGVCMAGGMCGGGRVCMAEGSMHGGGHEW